MHFSPSRRAYTSYSLNSLTRVTQAPPHCPPPTPFSPAATTAGETLKMRRSGVRRGPHPPPPPRGCAPFVLLPPHKLHRSIFLFPLTPSCSFWKIPPPPLSV